MEYLNYPRVQKAMFEKSINSLEGIIRGIKADEKINSDEIRELQNWCMMQSNHATKYPYMEIIPLIRSSISDGVLTRDEINDMLWMCSNFTHYSPYYDALTSAIQVLHGILHGILSDNVITVEELHYLREWVVDNDHLESMYPYDEVYSLLHKVLQDGILDDQEELMLKAFFTEFHPHYKLSKHHQGQYHNIQRRNKYSRDMRIWSEHRNRG